MSRFRLAVAAAVVVLSASAAARADTVSIGTGDFTGWTFGSGGTASATLEAAGGNPGARINITTISGPTVFASAVDPGTYSGFSLLGATYTLSTQVKSGAGAFGDGQRLDLVLQQGSTSYLLFNGPVTGFPLDWGTVSFSGTITAASPWRRLDTLAIEAPDLSGATATRFGFAGGNTISGTVTQYYDGLSFRLASAVPLPSSAALAGVGGVFAGLAVAARRRRRTLRIA